MPGYFRGADSTAVNIDLSDTSQRSPGQLPTRSGPIGRIPFLPKRVMEQIRSRAKQALPPAPASAPPATTVAASKPFYKMPVVWVGVAAVGFYFMTKKKGA